MATEALVTIWYDGEAIVSVSETDHIIHKGGVEKMRLKGSLLDVGNGLKDRLKTLNEQVKCGSVNPYRDALNSVEEIWNALNPSGRRRMSRKDVAAVVASIVKVAARSIQ